MRSTDYDSRKPRNRPQRRLGAFLGALLGAALGFAAPTQPVSITAIESLIRASDYKQAAELTQAALQQNPRDQRLWTLEGIAYSLEGEAEKALLSLDRALQLAPGYAPALKAKAKILYEKHDERAVPVLEALTKIDPADQTAHEMLGIVEARQGSCARAVDNFQASPETTAKHPASLELYGSCLENRKEHEQAIAVFEQLSVLLPAEAYPKYDLAVLLMETKRPAEAVKVLEPLLASTNDPDIFRVASEAYEAAGDTPKAVSLLRQAIVLRPTEPDYYSAFALLSLDHESYQVGIDVIDAGMKVNAGVSSMYLSRGLLYAQLAEYDKAEEDFTAAARLDSAQALSSYAMDLAELEKNHPEKALEQVRAQLKSHPNSALHHFLLAKVLQKQGPPGSNGTTKEAIASALAAVRLNPDFIEARDLLASLYIAAGQYKPAMEQCELALKHAPGDQSAMYQLIVALRHSGRNEDRARIPGLVARLSAAQQAAREADSGRRRFKLVEQGAAAR